MQFLRDLGKSMRSSLVRIGLASIALMLFLSAAPAFSVTTKGGVISSETLAGKPYMLEIFATWCPHCQRMTAVLRNIQKKFPPERLDIVSVTGSPVSAASTTLFGRSRATVVHPRVLSAG